MEVIKMEEQNQTIGVHIAVARPLSDSGLTTQRENYVLRVPRGTTIGQLCEQTGFEGISRTEEGSPYVRHERWLPPEEKLDPRFWYGISMRQIALIDSMKDNGSLKQWNPQTGKAYDK